MGIRALFRQGRVLSDEIGCLRRVRALARGFARVRCPECRREYLLASSCKQRRLASSCHANRQAAFGELLIKEVYEPLFGDLLLLDPLLV